MKRKILFSIVGVILFFGCFLVSVKTADYFYEQRLKNGIRQVKIGMTEEEVVQILGKPNHGWSEDGPKMTWCYDTDSIGHFFEEQPDIICPNMLLEMSSHKNGKVVKIFDF